MGSVSTQTMHDNMDGTDVNRCQGKLPGHKNPPSTTPSVDPPAPAPTPALAENRAGSAPSPASAPRSPRSRSRRWSKLARRPSFLTTLFVGSLALLFWNFHIRLRGTFWAPVVQARTATTWPTGPLTDTPLNPEAIAALRTRLQEARQFLVSGQEELVRLVTEIEQLAKGYGWRADVAMHPPQPAPGEMQQIRIYSATIKLTNQPIEGDDTQPGFRLIEWLRQMSLMEKKILLVQLNLQAPAGTLTTGQAEVQFWTQTEDATPAAENVLRENPGPPAQ